MVLFTVFLYAYISFNLVFRSRSLIKFILLYFWAGICSRCYRYIFPSICTYYQVVCLWRIIISNDYYLDHLILYGSRCFRKGDPFQGPKLGSCLTLGNELSEETHVLTKQEILLGRAPRWRAGGTQENCSVTWLAVSGFMVMGLVSGWSLANHSNSESFLVAHASLSQDGC